MTSRSPVQHARRLPAQLDRRDLAREGGQGEIRPLARAGVVEGARNHHVERARARPLPAQLLAGHLAGGIGVARRDGRLLGHGKARFGHGAVDVRAADVEQAAGEAGLAHGLQQVGRPARVDAERGGRVGPGRRHVALRGQVDDPVGPVRGDRAAQVVGVQDIGLVVQGAPGHVMIRVGLQELPHCGPDKPSMACRQQLLALLQGILRCDKQASLTMHHRRAGSPP